MFSAIIQFEEARKQTKSKVPGLVLGLALSTYSGIPMMTQHDDGQYVSKYNLISLKKRLNKGPWKVVGLPVPVSMSAGLERKP